LIKRKLISVVFVLLFLSGCSQDISKDTINTTNSSTEKDKIVLQLESDYFKFYSKDQDKECIKDLSNTLENNYTRITSDLKTSLNKKVNIYIFSDLSTFHEAINSPDAPSWVVGTALPGTTTIKMVNPFNADGRPYADMVKVLVHEFTHVVTMSINSDVHGIPTWLNEGVAAFEAEQYEGTVEVLSKAKSSNEYPTLKSLETGTNTFGNIGGYEFSYSITEYIVKTYGYDKLIALIKSPSEFEKILGLSKEDFQKEWVAHFD
jgi:RNA polymerase sigma-70 factor (ECF subfamily)